MLSGRNCVEIFKFWVSAGVRYIFVPWLSDGGFGSDSKRSGLAFSLGCLSLWQSGVKAAAGSSSFKDPIHRHHLPGSCTITNGKNSPWDQMDDLRSMPGDTFPAYRGRATCPWASQYHKPRPYLPHLCTRVDWYLVLKRTSLRRRGEPFLQLAPSKHPALIKSREAI